MKGILIIDKPQAFTSFDVVAVVRKSLHEKKVGHTGTLDPMATGVLPILLGSAAKAQVFLPDTDKEYVCEFRLGIATDTLDITGTVLKECPSAVRTADIERVLPLFRGNIQQKPPMYSAVSKDGVRLYELARKGIEVEREARPVTISELELLHFDETAQCGQLRLACSKGTYVRVLCDDMGKALHNCCTMTALRRTRACGFTLADAIPLAEVRELGEAAQKYLRPVDSLFAHLPALTVSEKQAFRFGNGGGLLLSRLRGLSDAADGTLYRVYDGSTFLGLGVVHAEKEELSVAKKF